MGFCIAETGSSDKVSNISIVCKIDFASHPALDVFALESNALHCLFTVYYRC